MVFVHYMVVNVVHYAIHKIDDRFLKDGWRMSNQMMNENARKELELQIFRQKRMCSSPEQSPR